MATIFTKSPPSWTTIWPTISRACVVATPIFRQNAPKNRNRTHDFFSTLIDNGILLFHAKFHRNWPTNVRVIW